MPSYRQFSEDDALAAAERALSQALGHAVTVRRGDRLGGEDRRNLILRAEAIEPSGLSRSIIIKATRAEGYDPSAADTFAASGLVKEWAAVSLLDRHENRSGVGPRLRAADLDRGVLVFEDVGKDLPSLVRPLLHGSAAEAEHALVTYAKAVGRLHAETAGCQAEHAALVRGAFPSSSVPLPGRTWVDLVARKVAASLGGTLPEAEIDLVASRLRSPGPWLALVHRDPCPDNVLLGPGERATLVDFEFSSPGHALLDAAYWRVEFPTCWCAGQVPEPVASRVDQAYRAVVAEAIPPAADDDAFAEESAIVSLVWLFESLDWQLEPALRDDAQWGIASRRGRILQYLDVAIGTLAERRSLPELRHLLGRWLDQLQARWPSAERLSPYPAFRNKPS